MKTKKTMFSHINFVEIFGAFIVMAAIIDIFGSIPIFVSMKEQHKTIKAGQARNDVKRQE